MPPGQSVTVTQVAHTIPIPPPPPRLLRMARQWTAAENSLSWNLSQELRRQQNALGSMGLEASGQADTWPLLMVETVWSCPAMCRVCVILKYDAIIIVQCNDI